MALASSSDSFGADNKSVLTSPAPGLSPNGGAPGAQNRSASWQYQRAQVETASPVRLIILLYDGAIRFCMTGLDAMRRGDLESQHTHLLKAQRILAELMGSLDREAGGEVASN